MIRLAKASIGLSLFALAAFSMFTPACGSDDCVSVCTRGKECNLFKGVDCDQACSDLEATAANGDCSSQFDDWIECEAAVTDICKAGQCTQQFGSIGTCFLAYCPTHQTEAGCQDLTP